MKNVLRNISLYISFITASIKEMLIYRLDCIVGILSQTLTQVVEIIFIWIVFQNTSNLAGWSYEQILLLYGITLMSVSVCSFLFDATYDLGPVFIREGEFDKLLLRPVHPLISVLGSSKDFVSFGYLVIGLIITIMMFTKLAIPITFWLIIKLLFFIIIGGLILGGIETIFSVAAFWTYRSNEVVWTFYRVYTLTQYPIDIYSGFVKILITFILPFAFVAYYPTMDYLGFNKYMIWLSPVVAIIIWIIAIGVWNWALKKYRSTGT